MYAIAFDLTVTLAERHHPRQDASAAYSDIRRVLERHGFEWKQGSLYVTDSEDMAALFSAIMALRALPWFPTAVRDIRAFRVEQWSDFTALVKGHT